MNLSMKILGALSAVFLLSACETAPGTGGAAGGAGAGDGSGLGVDGSGVLPGTDIGDRVFFDYDSSIVRGDGEATLQRQAEYLKQYPYVKVTMEGHCDERGTREYNLALGERRANAAKSYLVSLGIESSRISTISYGKERPAVVGSDENSFAMNRRAVTVVTNQ